MTRYGGTKTQWKPDFTIYNSNSRNQSVLPSLPQIQESTTPNGITPIASTKNAGITADLNNTSFNYMRGLRRSIDVIEYPCNDEF